MSVQHIIIDADSVQQMANKTIASPILIGNITNMSTMDNLNVTGAVFIPIVLTPGDWDVTGVADFLCSAGTTVTSLQCASSTTNGDFDGTQDADAVYQHAGANLSGQERIPIPTRRIQITDPASQIIYLVVRAIFGTSTAFAWGSIRARRVR